MAQLKTPGVFIEEISTIGASVAPVATAVPAFLGYTTNHASLSAGSAGGSAKLPVRISSFKEFEQVFGKSTETAVLKIEDVITGVILTSRTLSVETPLSVKNKLYYHMQLYFTNGGGPCYIVSIGSTDVTSMDDDHFTAGLDEIKLVDEPTLLVFPEAYDLGSSEHGNVVKAALSQCATLQDRFVIADINKTDASNPDAFRGNVNSINNKYGSLYYPALNTTISSYLLDTGITINHKEEIDGVPAPDGIYDGLSVDVLLNGRTTPTPVIAPDLELYTQLKNLLNIETLTLPASAAIAGVYALIDNQRGVWKAPANVPLELVVSPSVKLSDADQEGLNVDTNAGISINAIRSFTGKGNLVWGARTMDGNSAEWRYINVRRLFIFIEESIQKSMQSYVFESNTAQTWLRLKGTIDNFLTGLWRQGALAGAKPNDAFFVKVGLGTTMTSDDILNGILNIEIGLAAARPAEFIVLKFSQTLQVS